MDCNGHLHELCLNNHLIVQIVQYVVGATLLHAVSGLQVIVI